MLTNANGVEDSRTVVEHCEILRAELKKERQRVLEELSGKEVEARAQQVFGAWIYALDTMIQQAKGRETCAWLVAGSESAADRLEDGGEIWFRRV